MEKISVGKIFAVFEAVNEEKNNERYAQKGK